VVDDEHVDGNCRGFLQLKTKLLRDGVENIGGWGGWVRAEFETDFIDTVEPGFIG
jgi:hypothetical protein